MTMTIGDLIEVRSFPAVVQAADVRALRAVSQDGRDTLDEAARDFMGGYLGYDERSRHAVDTTVRSLAGEGGAFFLNGVFGSGKSHLLGLLALLADGIGHSAFASTHPHLGAPLGNFARRLVVHFSLDDYAAARFSLEEIFWREARSEWKRRGLPPEEVQLPETGSRSEVFAAFEDAQAARGLHGLVVCIDELSLFLSAREHQAMQGDASFLQFLGQRARRRSTHAGAAPLWVIAALQKTVEDIGDLDAYALSQIRDRFTTLPLSLAHLPSLIERRLIVRKDAAALHGVCSESYERLLRALPRLDFGREEWEQLYPFHPATAALLESVAARFLSRTRSAALFCSEAVQPSGDATGRVPPDALFDYVEPELGNHPDLRPLATVWHNWRDTESEIAADDGEAAPMRSLMKALLLWKIAGGAPSVAQLANAVALDARLPGDGNYEYCRILLEKMRMRGGSIAVERREGEFADRYAIDLGARVSEMARRFTSNLLHTLPEHDRRIARHALHCCRDETLPLASLENASALSVMWRNAPRGLRIEVVNEPPGASVLANRLAALAEPGHNDDLALFIAPPFGDRPASGEAWHEVWHEAVREAAQAMGGSQEAARWRGAIAWWTPRPATRDEWQLAREATAGHLLLGDPQLHDNRRGRAVLEHLKSGAPEREAALGRTAARLLREGQIATGGGAVVDAADLAGRDSWVATLEALAEFVLPHVFPRFEEVAPRLRVLTAANSEALCLDILRRPAAAPFFAASLERAARAIAAPLGVATETQGRWKITAPRDDLIRGIRALIAESGATLQAVEATLAKSEWGLHGEQIRVALCALLRSGDLVACNARGAVLPPAHIGLPLRRSVHALRPGRLLDTPAWSRLGQLAALLTGETLGAVSFAEQERARTLLATWREDAAAQTELAQARLHQLRRRLKHTPAQWPHTAAAWEQIEALLAALNSDGATFEALMRAASLDTEALRAAIATWRATIEHLEQRHAALLEAHTFLTHPELAPPTAMQDSRAALLARFDAGEALLADADLPIQAARWRDEYSAHYRDWHSAQHAPARFSSYRRLAASDAARALDTLAALASRPFPHGRELQAALARELAKGCLRDGSLHPDEPVCAACRLRLNERLTLRDPRELEAVAQEGIAAFHAALREAPVRDYLARRETGAALLEWGGAGETLLSLLSEGTLRVLDEAFRPRRRVARSWSQLQESVSDCRTRAEWRAALLAWLDNGENLQDDDEVALTDIS